MLNKNYILSKTLISAYSKLGVQHAFISPGSRNTPLVLALSDQKKIKTYNIIDERSSGYIGLGLSKVSKTPILIITTSGTAVANLFPSIIEAYMSCVPMIILTADRPKKLINTVYNYRPDLLIFGHADLIKGETLAYLKDNYKNLRIAQWFLDPLVKNGPDYNKNKSRILDKIEFTDANFITTSPDVLKFLPKNKPCLFMPNPTDPSFEVLNNYKNNQCSMDVFFALSHGVHRGILKKGKYDERADFVNRLVEITPNVKFDLYGINNIQPIWADSFLRSISNAKMGVNLSRGSPIKYYSSDRITQIIGNGLVTLIDQKTQYNDFFNKDEMVFYKNVSDLSEKILKLTRDDKLRRKIGMKGKLKYLKHFNSTLVAEFIINKTLAINNNKKFYWHN